MGDDLRDQFSGTFQPDFPRHILAIYSNNTLGFVIALKLNSQTFDQPGDQRSLIQRHAPARGDKSNYAIQGATIKQVESQRCSHFPAN
jgi:hypothetical protein